MITKCIYSVCDRLYRFKLFNEQGVSLYNLQYYTFVSYFFNIIKQERNFTERFWMQ